MKRDRAKKLIYAMQRLLAVFFLASGCTTTALDEPEIAFKPGDDEYLNPECPDDACGMNGNNMGWYFNELDLNHTENSGKIRFITFVPPPGPVTHIEVGKDRLLAYDGTALLPSWHLKNTRIRLRDRDDVLWIVEITDVHNTEGYWAKNTGPVESYTMQYWQFGAAHNKSAFCDAEPGASFGVQSDAVVFRGERYDAVTKMITPTDDDSTWFNIACFNSIPAKLFMMRHTEASSNPGLAITTTIEQRRALLNAWTGNYCGDGRSFTFSGEPLLLCDSKKWIVPTSGWSWPGNPFGSYDAMWDHDGATCIDVPRLTTSALAEDEDILQDIQAHCEKVGRPPIPSCTRKELAWPGGTHILSANPAGS